MKRLRTLFVYDSEDDAMLLVEELRRGGFKPVYERVDTPEGLREALKDEDLDIILMDYTMPCLDASASLGILKESGLDVPCIVISGTVGEEAAVEAMRAGASDYIMKGHLVRLVPAIRRELKELEARRRHRDTMESLEESKEKFKLLFEGSNDAIFLADTKTRMLVDCNRQAEKLTGFPRGRLLSMKADELHPEELRESTIEGFRQQAEGLHRIVETEVLTSEGARVPVSISGAVVKIGGRRYIQGVFRDVTARRQAEQELEASRDRMMKIMKEVVQAMAATVEIRDPYTAGHQRRVAKLAAAIAAGMGMKADDVEGVYMSAVIHDLGKLYVPSEILVKPGRITDTEFSIIKTHSRMGYNILKNIGFPWPVADIVLQHHERMDGSGYPEGLEGEAILVQARIIGVADVVEAMASHRPYRPALGIDAALEEIEKGSGGRYDPDAARECVRLFRERGFTLDE